MSTLARRDIARKGYQKPTITRVSLTINASSLGNCYSINPVNQQFACPPGGAQCSTT